MECSFVFMLVSLTQPDLSLWSLFSVQLSGCVRMEFYSQRDVGFRALVDQINRDDFVNAWAAVLNNLVGRGNRRSINGYNQWRTVAPYLASLCHWCFTGQPCAPGNPHVMNTPHHPGNVHVPNFRFAAADNDLLLQRCRELFPWAEVQQRRFGDYFKHLCVVDREHETTYLVRLHWDHAEKFDNIVVHVRSFAVVPEVEQADVNAVVVRFRHLGFGPARAY